MLAGTVINIAGVFLLHFGVMSTILVNITSLVAGGVNTMIPQKKRVPEQTDAGPDYQKMADETDGTII